MGLRISTCSHCVRHKLLLLPNCGCKGTPSSPLKPSKKPRPFFLLPFTLNIISLNINIETIIHPDIIHTPSCIYIKGIYIIRYIIINSQSRRYTPHTKHPTPLTTSRNGLFRFMLIYIYALIQSSCRFTLLLPVGQWVYDKSRVHINLKHPTGCIRCTCCIKDLKQQSPQGYSCHSPYSCSSSKRLQV